MLHAKEMIGVNICSIHGCIDTLPLVKDAISKLQGDGNTRPKKVTAYAVQKMLGLPDKQINHLPQCRKEIEKFHESQEQYWAREVVWAVNKILNEGQVLNWKHIRNLTNMKKRDIILCLPEIKKVVSDEFYRQIKNVI